MPEVAIKNLLVPTDFSDCSEAALDYGRTFARVLGARLHVLHVLEDPARYARKAASQALVPEMRKHMEVEAREQLDRLGLEADTAVRTVLRWGEPHVEIVEYAAEEAIDLIAIGTHGRGPVQHMLLGSVAEKVLRRAPCPVLTVQRRDPV